MKSPAKILFVGQIPGDGPAGLMLQVCVQEAGLDWSALRFTNAISYRVPSNKPTDAELAAEKPRLLAEITEMPDLAVIVALGNDAMKQLTGKSGIMDKRGEEFQIQLDDRPLTVLPTFHPAFVLRQRTRRPELVRDLVRAEKLSKGLPLLDPAQNVDFQNYSPSLIIGGRFAIDVETDGNNRPRLFAVGREPVYVTVHPAAQVAGNWHIPQWVGHNLRADQIWLRQLGVELGPLRDDTMLMAHLLNENRSMSLKKLALELLDPRLYWQYVEPLLRRAKTRGQIPYEELGVYCANDVAATLLLYDAMRPQLAAEPRLERIYTALSLPLSDALLEVEWHGVLFDTVGAHRLQAEYGMRKTLIADDLNTMLYDYGLVNYGSHPQVRKVLYEHLGLKPPHFTDGGEGSTDERALMALRDQHEFVRLLLQWRKADKMSQIIESWRSRQGSDGRVRPRYNQTGTVTGRLSSSGPNAQNPPTGRDFRSLIIAPPGRVIVAADYKTIEMGVAAWIFDEPTMLAAYKDQMSGGEDLHTRTARSLLGRPPANADERKKYGKTPNFGLLYQQGDLGFREYAAKQGVDMTLPEAAAMRAAWHNMYPGIREGWRRIGNLMKANGGTVVAPSGRKRRLPEFLSGNKALQNEAWRQGCNFPVQCTAAELTHVAAIVVHGDLLRGNLILHVHDSLVFEVDEDMASTWPPALRLLMEQTVPLYFEQNFGTPIPIPLRVDIVVGPSWGEAA